MTRASKKMDSHPDVGLALMQNLREAATDCKACAKAEGRVSEQTRGSARDGPVFP